MGVQIPCGIHSEISKEGAVRAIADPFGGGVAPTGAAQGEPNRRRAPDAGPRAHVDLDPTEICGISGGGVHQGEECDPPCANVWGTQAKLRWVKLLGARIFCVYSGSGRSADSGIHSQPGEGRPEAGAIEPLALIGPPLGGKRRGAA